MDIPKSEFSFNSFERNLVNFLEPLAIEWGIPAQATTDLISYQTTYQAAWLVGGIGNEKTRTSVQVLAKQDARKAFEHSYKPNPLGLRAYIAAYITFNPLISDEQRLAMGITIHKKTRTKHTVATKAKVMFFNTPLGAGIIETKCYSTGTDDQNPFAKGANGKTKTPRPSKETGFEVQIAYKIVDLGVVYPLKANDEGLTLVSFTKAVFQRDFESKYYGKVLCEFARWYSPKHPELSGPWSSISSSMIS